MHIIVNVFWCIDGILVARWTPSAPVQQSHHLYTTYQATLFIPYCAAEGTAFPCDGGGSGGGQLGALSPALFAGGFLGWEDEARGAGIGRVVVSAASNAGGAAGGGGTWRLGGAGGLDLENRTVGCSSGLPDVEFTLKNFFAAGWERENRRIEVQCCFAVSNRTQQLYPQGRRSVSRKSLPENRVLTTVCDLTRLTYQNWSFSVGSHFFIFIFHPSPQWGSLTQLVVQETL